MSAGKIGCLVLYAVLALLALSQPGTIVATAAIWILLTIAVVHVAEMVLLYGQCKQAGGSLPENLLKGFLFGYFHMVEMKEAARKN